MHENEIPQRGLHCLLRLHIENQRATILIQNDHLVTIEPQFGFLEGRRESAHSLLVVVENESTVLIKLVETILI